ncbi:MAG: hypothetical protein ACI4AA_11545 [Lachnospiraceae bacterium]
MKIKPLWKEAEAEQPTQDCLKKEFREAKRFGEIRLGTEYLFYRGFVRVRFIPLRECERIYLRVEFGEYGEFPLHEHYVIVVTKQGKELKLRMERPDDAKDIMAFLEEVSGDLKLGKETDNRDMSDEGRRTMHG